MKPHLRLSAIKNVLILKADRVYAAMLRQAVRRIVPDALVWVANRVDEAAAAVAKARVHLLLTGVGLTGGDTLDFLSACVGESRRVEHVLVVTGRRDQRLLVSLQALPIDGVFDSSSEDFVQFRRALRSVVSGIPYWSPSVSDRIRQECLSPVSLCRRLTPTEQLVLAVLGDGCDDNAAADHLDLKESTIHSVRRVLHRKLGAHHRGDLVRLAVQHGFVRLNPEEIVRPGFAATLAARQARRKHPLAA